MTPVRALSPGDSIGIAAPASPFDRSWFMKGIGTLKKFGFRPVYRSDIFDQNRYLAGTDERRSQEFMEFMCDEMIAAVMFARGGYGCQRVIPLLDLEKLKRHPKPVIGFSDITALLTFLQQAAGIPTFYGPVLTQLGRTKGTLTGKNLFRALTSKGTLGTMPMGQAHTIRPGRATGTLAGGCLSLINSSMGTPYELKTEGRILFIEETGEKVYVLDRMLTQLKNSGKLDLVRGVVFGSLIPTEDEPHDVEAMIRELFEGFDGPVIAGFPAGHTDEFVTLPLGAQVELEAPGDEPPRLTYTTGLLS
jgi:muramoyltetrapeptide carboxypeptidase